MSTSNTVLDIQEIVQKTTAM